MVDGTVVILLAMLRMLEDKIEREIQSFMGSLPSKPHHINFAAWVRIIPNSGGQKVVRFYHQARNLFRTLNCFCQYAL